MLENASDVLSLKDLREILQIGKKEPRFILTSVIVSLSL